jgi:hypothetical protein
MDRATNRQETIMTDLYDTDILQWSEHQTMCLQQRCDFIR